MQTLELPPTDNEYWTDADKASVDKSTLKALLCDAHERVRLDVGQREIHCTKCGWGKKIHIHKIQIEEGNLTDNSTGKTYLLDK